MVKKGQTIGGGGQAGARRGGMLPPSGSGPVEVTPEWLAEQRRAEAESAGAAAPGAPVVVDAVVPAQQAPVPHLPAAAEMERPGIELPDPDAEPAEQLAVCERGIHGAKARWTATIARANEDFIAEAGPYLEWMHQHKLYKLMLDNGGKPYRSFAKYLKEQHDLTERTGYRITQTIPLLRILAGAGHALPDLSARQVGVLHPVRTQHGDAAVSRVWSTAWETKKGPLPTPDELEKAKVLLGFATKPEPDDGEKKELPSADPGAVVERATKLLVPDTVRAAVKQDPERVRQLVRVLNTALSEAGVPVD
jgi:hypothetical protein